MILSLFGLIALTVSGLGLFRLFARSANLQFSFAIEVGVGFFISAAIAAWALNFAPLSISHASQIILLLCSLGAALTVASIRQKRGTHGLTRFISVIPESTIDFAILILIAGYLLLVLLNNIDRDVFPWDAFTTWMFRAKAWVTTDTAVEFMTLGQWLAASSGFTLPAAHYPIAVSAIAAFSSALSGGWSGQAASLPWFFVTLASAMMMGGLCRLQAPENPRAGYIGAALLVTIPLVHLHGIFAGYADIWVMGTSGMGLAGICLWTQQKSAGMLILSLVLLALGCLWKSEGWLWLMIGGAVALGFWSWQRYASRALIFIGVLFLLILMLQPIDLGLLGVWGIEDQRISVGVLGAFAARPYNPIADYFDLTVLRGNFLLIVPLYFLALLFLAINKPRNNAGYLVMAACLLGIHGIVFGLSEYSRYAEIGTAVNRFLLQSLPVLILTITAAWQQNTQQTRINPSARATVGWDAAIKNTVMAALGILVSLPLTLIFFNAAPSSTSNEASREYQPSELISIVGDLEETSNQYQFTGVDIPIGVAAIPLSESGGIQARYVVTESWMREPETLSLYWINSNDQQVHSSPVPLSGYSVMDMADYPDFWQQPIREMGFLVEPRYFDAVGIGPVVLTDSLFDALPALFNHWRSPAPLSHRLINSATGHLEAPITLQSWLVTALLLFCICALIGRQVLPAQAAAATKGLLISIGALWIIGSTAYIAQAVTLSQPVLPGTQASASRERLEGTYLQALAHSIKQRLPDSQTPILALGLEPTRQFEAQRLPYELLPLRATAVGMNQLPDISQSFSGVLVLFSEDEAKLRETGEALTELSGMKVLESGLGYLMLSAEAE